MKPTISAAALAIALIGAGCSGANDAATADSPPAVEAEPAREPSITIEPQSGATGSEVRLQASGFRSGAVLELGFGPPESEYEVIQTAEAGEDGRVSVVVTVPGWAESGQDYVFVAAERDSTPKAISEPFTVTAR